MARPQRLGLSAVRSEGAILPPSILQRIHREDPSLGGMTPDDFGLSGMRVREAASQAWNALQGPWRAFQAERARLAPTAPTAGMTRTRWLNQIAKALDYGAIDPISGSIRIDDREFPVSHLYDHTPIHWVGFRVDLDQRTPGEVGAARMSPHGMVQLLLNASDNYLWGFVSNGLRWRILRDDNSLSRQSMVEFDLEAIFEGQLYDEFLLFYLLCHQTRVKAEKPEECWLERWSQAAASEGKRALDTLRNGVEKAIETLGQGFLKHSVNHSLRQGLRDGKLDKQGYYRQLLRLVYRLLFLFVAEDRVDAKGRSLLHVPEATEEARSLYAEFYSTQRLRLLAERLRGSHRHHDLFQQLRLVLGKLGQEDGCPDLGLPALGGFLFSPEACPDLDGAELSNGDLLEAIRCLAVTQEGGRRTRVDYKNLASEEMGSVYESLLELHPDLSTDGTKFELRSASGNERKTTGSYYTPDSLIQCLLDTALDPVVDEAVRTARQKFQPKDGEPPEAQAILNLKVIDPAVGSGHFLIAAAHRMAKRLAQARTGDDEPAPEATRRALRDVIGRCLYGIDVNPMSAELCKVALWMEALEPGKPLSFLDHHIQVGNSLLGATPELIADGIPDEAYTAIAGDEKAICSALKRQNRSEREGQGSLFAPEVFSGGSLLTAWRRLEGLSDETFKNVQEKASRYREARAALGLRKALADTWCAAFVLPKTSETRANGFVVTTSTIQALAAGGTIAPALAAAVDEVVSQFEFLHPHIAFPDVFANGGFNVVLGNPPWERIKLQEQEWFASRRPDVANAPNAAARRRLIAELRTEAPNIYREFVRDRRTAEGESHFIRNSGRYPRCGRGDVNTYAIFAEAMSGLHSATGAAGVIVPTGIATDDSTKEFFRHVMETGCLVSLYDFDNREGLFPAVRRHQQFCLLTMFGASRRTLGNAEFASFLSNVAQLNDPARRYQLSLEDIALINPNSRTAPMFRTGTDAALVRDIFRGVPVLLHDGPPEQNSWGISFQRMLDMANDSEVFRTEAQLSSEGWEACGPWFLRGSERYIPLFDAKMAQQYHHRAANLGASGHQFRKISKESTDANDLIDSSFFVTPLYWVREKNVEERLGSWPREWLLGFKDVTGTTSTSLGAFAIIPRLGVGHTFPITFTSEGTPLTLALLANLNALVTEYVLRCKVQGLHLTYFILKQIPVLPPARYSELNLQYIAPRVLELCYTAWDLYPLANDVWLEADPQLRSQLKTHWEEATNEVGGHGWQPPEWAVIPKSESELRCPLPPFKWDEERRFRLRCELDAAYFHLYGLSREDVDYILDALPILRRKDMAAHGRYRTKESVLEVYDEMVKARDKGLSLVMRSAPSPRAHQSSPSSLQPDVPLQRDAQAITSASSVQSGNGSRACTVPPSTKVAVPSEPEELLLTPPSRKPLRDKDGQEMRVRVYSASEEVLLKRGLAVGKRKNGEGMVWSVIPDGETVPRDFGSPPCVVKRLKPKGGS